MSVRLKCEEPSQLLELIKKKIDTKEIETWIYDVEGDLTHSPEQWRYEAWLRPKVKSGELELNIIGQKGKAMSKTIYAIYHGRFVEMALTHFDKRISTAIVSSMPVAGDLLGRQSS